MPADGEPTPKLHENATGLPFPETGRRDMKEKVERRARGGSVFSQYRARRGVAEEDVASGKVGEDNLGHAVMEQRLQRSS